MGELSPRQDDFVLRSSLQAQEALQPELLLPSSLCQYPQGGDHMPITILIIMSIR